MGMIENIMRMPDCASRGQKKAQLLKIEKVDWTKKLPNAQLVRYFGKDLDELYGTWILLTLSGDKGIPFVWVVPYSKEAWERLAGLLSEEFSIKR